MSNDEVSNSTLNTNEALSCTLCSSFRYSWWILVLRVVVECTTLDIVDTLCLNYTFMQSINSCRRSEDLEWKELGHATSQRVSWRLSMEHVYGSWFYVRWTRSAATRHEAALFTQAHTLPVLLFLVSVCAFVLLSLVETQHFVIVVSHTTERSTSTNRVRCSSPRISLVSRSWSRVRSSLSRLWKWVESGSSWCCTNVFHVRYFCDGLTHHGWWWDELSGLSLRRDFLSAVSAQFCCQADSEVLMDWVIATSSKFWFRSGPEVLMDYFSASSVKIVSQAEIWRTDGLSSMRRARNSSIMSTMGLHLAYVSASKRTNHGLVSLRGADGLCQRGKRKGQMTFMSCLLYVRGRYVKRRIQKTSSCRFAGVLCQRVKGPGRSGTDLR